MWELEYKESWVLKNGCFWTLVLEKSLESPLDCKEIKLVNCKGNQFRIFIGRTHAEAETWTLWLPDGKNWLTGKDPDAGQDWRWEEKGTTENEMVGWHHWFMDMSLNMLQELVMDRGAWRALVHGVTKIRTWLSDWTELNWVIQSCPTLCDPMDCSPPGSLSLEFSRQEHWSELPDPGIKPRSPALQVDYLLSHQGTHN